MLTELSALLDLLKAKGVTRYDGPLFLNEALQQRVCLEIATPAPALPKEDTSPAEDAETCRCGCPLFIHVNGLCGRGCEVEKCAPPEKE